MTHWAEVGKSCICIHEGPWWFKVESGILAALFGNVIEQRDGPKFMQEYKITDILVDPSYEEGHTVKLQFAEYPGEHYCSCQFRPLEKLGDEEEIITKERIPENV